MSIKKNCIFLIVVVVMTVVVSAKAKKAGLFESDDILELTLVQDLDTLKKDIADQRSYHPAQLSYRDQNGHTVTLNVELKTRGTSRRDSSMCDFPPLLIKFNKTDAKPSLFKKQKTLKLVTHCKAKNEAYEQYILKEYLTYRLYNLLTDKSFRVRLARVTYEDSLKKNNPICQYAFFIEDEDKMAKRLNGVMDKTTMKYSVFQQKEAQILLEIFQYLVGNTDWSIPARHNVKIIKAGAEQALYAVPYDFDMSGLVNAEYAFPNVKILTKIKSVRQRLFRGLCRTQEEYTPVIVLLNNKKEALYALCTQFALLDQKHKKEILTYLDEFYDIINSPKAVKKNLVETCLKI